MADDTFRTVLPRLKAVDNGDGTYSMPIKHSDLVSGGSDTVCTDTVPRIRFRDLGSTQYALSGYIV